MVPYTAPHLLILKHKKKHRIGFLYKCLPETLQSLDGYQMLPDPKHIFCSSLADSQSRRLCHAKESLLNFLLAQLPRSLFALLPNWQNSPAKHIKFSLHENATRLKHKSSVVAKRRVLAFHSHPFALRACPFRAEKLWKLTKSLVVQNRAKGSQEREARA